MMSRLTLGALFTGLLVLVHAQGGPGGPGMGQRGPGGPGGPRGMRGPEFEAIKKYLELEQKARYAGTRYQEVITPDGVIRGSETLLVDGQRRRIEFGKDSTKFGEVIVDNGQQRMHYFAASNEIHMVPRVRDEFRRKIGDMGDRKGPPPGLKVITKDGGRVANRTTKLVAVMDERGNPFQKMWFDPQTGVMLKREGYDFTGRRISLMEFRRINYDVRPSDADFSIKRAGAVVVKPQTLLVRSARRAGMPALMLTDPSLKLESSMVRDFRDRTAVVSIYGTNEGRISLMVMKGGLDNERLERAGQRGGGPGGIHKWEFNGYSCVLMGPVSKAKLQAFSRTLTEIKR